MPTAVAHAPRSPGAKPIHVRLRRRIVVHPQFDIDVKKDRIHREGNGGEGGHGDGGRPHEYYHPKTPDEIRVAGEWRRLEREKAEAETLLRSLEGQRKAWMDHALGLQGLANAGIRTPRLTSPTPYGKSYFALRNDIARLNLLPPDSPEIAKIRHENPDAYQLWQSHYTRSQKFGNLLWSLSAKGGLHAVAKGWETLTKPFGPLGKLLNWPVQKVIENITHLFGDLPTGPHDLANPGAPQFKVSQPLIANKRHIAYKIAEHPQLVAEAAKKLADANAQMTAIAGRYKWVHNLAHASEH